MQTVPQLPQFVLLELALTQLPTPKPPPRKPARPCVHCVSPEGHEHVPLTQARPPGQIVPHDPQLRLSVCRLAHELVFAKKNMLVQAVVPLGHPPHIPFVHCWPPGQRVPQLPQLLLSVCVLVQVLLHIESPMGHVHIPPLQVAPDGHALPHVPQWEVSVWRSTHALLQSVSIAPASLPLQLTLHRPALHTGVPDVAEHALPHTPQLAGSLCTAVHAPPLHIRSPAGHEQRPA
jgi:hypothetical protein